MDNETLTYKLANNIPWSEFKDLKKRGHLSYTDGDGETRTYRPDEIILDKNIPAEKVPEVINLTDIISKNFYPFFSVSNPIKQPYRILKGGRSSLKSSTVAIKLVKDFLEDDQANIIGFRKVGKYLSTSIYEQIKWAIYLLKVENEFTFMKSPLKIIHDRTETAFYFNGVDDPLKIKSHKIANGYILRLWYEEAAEFDGEEEIDTVNDTFIRQELPDGKQVEIYFTYNPPRNPYNWINEFAEKVKDEDDYYVHHSDYEEDSLGVLSQQFIRRVERMKVTDPDYYKWMYKGQIIGLGDVVYNYSLFRIVKELPDDERILFSDIAIDSGYSTSATTFLYLGYTNKRNVILLDTFYYSPRTKVVKKAPSDFADDLWEFMERNRLEYKLNLDTNTIDSAEGALRNEMFKQKGLVLKPAKKKTKVKMIENVETLLAESRIIVLNRPSNKVFLDEHKKYQWDEDTLQSADPKVIKVDDHTCDAFQYYVNNNLSKLGLKV